jgi:hypothetical protein
LWNRYFFFTLLLNTQKECPMKTLTYKLAPILIFTLLLGMVRAQIPEESPIENRDFRHVKHQGMPPSLPGEGCWMQVWNEGQAGTVVMTLKQPDEMRWGNYLNILPGSRVEKGYSAPCGNDTNIHRHSGTYQVIGRQLLLDLGEQGTRSFDIVEMGLDKLVLKPNEGQRW